MCKKKNQKKSIKDSDPSLPRLLLCRKSLQNEPWTTCKVRYVHDTTKFAKNHLLTLQACSKRLKKLPWWQKDVKILEKIKESPLKKMSRGKVPRMCYIKAKKGFISLILTHTLIFSDTQRQYTHKKRGLSSSSTPRHLFKELVSSYLYKKYK